MTMLALPRAIRIAVVAGCILVLILLSHVFYAPITPTGIKGQIRSTASRLRGRPQYDPKKLHMLIPATSTNHHLCQLMTSAVVLGYPAPILLNWGGVEDADDYVQHLQKVEVVLSYVESLPEEQQDELVFMMDGFDAWFQLPADIMIKRYYDVVDFAHQQNVEMYGADGVERHDIRDTVLFGPDKLCWPEDPNRAACWVVPESWMPEQGFGPDTDHGIHDHNRARWLNSGTILGPAREVREVFAATLAKIHDHHTTDSDQFYFSNVWADQSYARRLVGLEYDRSRGVNVSETEAKLLPPPPPPPPPPQEVPEGEEPPPPPPPPPPGLEIPELKEGKNYELHIGLDFSSDIWQTIAYYEDYMTWVQHNYSSRYTLSDAAAINPSHHFTMPADLVGLSPIMALARNGDRGNVNYEQLPEAMRSWATVPLATNTVSKTIAPVLHFTGKKSYRELWWPRNWFWPYQEEIFKWLRERGVVREGEWRDPLAGGWTYSKKNRKGWVNWEDGLCGAYEERLRGKFVG
jgi:hypothetical protein